MSSPSLNRRKTKTAWCKKDDIRLCRSFVLATQCTEHVKHMWNRVESHYAALAADEDPVAIPRAIGALQTHWSTFIRPETFFFMSLLLKVETESHEGWKEDDYTCKTLNRFEIIRKAEEAEVRRAYDMAEQQALLQNADVPCKPRIKATKFRYLHCIPILRMSKRFMHAVRVESVPRMKQDSAQKRQYRMKRSSCSAENTVEVSKALDESSNRHDRSSTQHEPSLKRCKNSDASAGRASGLASGSSPLILPHGKSSGEAISMANGTAIAAAALSRTVASSNVRGSDMPRGDEDALNGRTSLVETPILRTQRTQQKANYRLKLLTELRGIVDTISHLANQIANGKAAPMDGTVGSRSDPTLAEEVQQDLDFFREQKCLLKQELEALDDLGGRTC